MLGRLCTGNCKAPDISGGEKSASRVLGLIAAVVIIFQQAPLLTRHGNAGHLAPRVRQMVCLAHGQL